MNPPSTTMTLDEFHQWLQVRGVCAELSRRMKRHHATAYRWAQGRGDTSVGTLEDLAQAAGVTIVINPRKNAKILEPAG